MKKNILIIASKGMLAFDLISQLKNQGIEPICFAKDEIDITIENQIIEKISSIKPEIIINCAAYTNVDLAESNIEKAYEVNAEGVKNLALLCKKIDIPLVHISTDYIFDGRKNSPYLETDKTNPLNIYGKSKLKGEEYITQMLDKYYIVRTSWLYGKNGKNFVETIIKLGLENNEVKVVDDQMGSPTWTVDLSKAILFIIENAPYGTYQVTNSNTCTWRDFAEYIFKIKNINTKILPVTTDDFPRPALRPRYSVMSNKKVNELSFFMPTWQESVENYLKLD